MLGLIVSGRLVSHCNFVLIVIPAGGGGLPGFENAAAVVAPTFVVVESRIFHKLQESFGACSVVFNCNVVNCFWKIFE